MTSTQGPLDGFLTALDLERVAATELRHLADADTQGSRVSDLTDLSEDLDVRWTQIESRRARDGAVRTRRRLALTVVSVCVVTGVVAIVVFLHDTDRIGAPIRPPMATDLNSSGQGPAAQAGRQTMTTTVVDGGVLITGINAR
ncbi:hypothetical protein [Nocardia arthritidis]|uniref:Uncharacterized protein n=1 Tax=Nocardia arthritidis TaxID=228602 RepID=A0A6G9Y990_9NOCA|nr:hypothetical protein [Nocardia arthritidis]QIS09835.1 hypothetical protein F5544_09675 [Nocardia arthritidis]